MTQGLTLARENRQKRPIWACDLQFHTLQAQQQLVIARVHAAVRQQADEVQRVLLESGLQPLPALVLEDVAALQ